MNKSVSIIIPTYNRRIQLRQNLDAIDRQRFEGYLEVIVVDDESVDGTSQILKRVALRNNNFVFKYFRSDHIGSAEARNLAISNSKGDILIFLDDDSMIQNENYVNEVIKSFQEDNVGIVAGKTIDILTGIYRLIRIGDPPEINFDNELHPHKFSKSESMSIYIVAQKSVQ